MNSCKKKDKGNDIKGGQDMDEGKTQKIRF